MLTNLRYQWHEVTYQQATLTKSSSPVVMLGKTYIKGMHFAGNAAEVQAHKFLSDFKQIAWVTYRENFRPLFSRSRKRVMTSDRGWGCTIRVGQMMLMTAIKRHLGIVWPDLYLLQSIQEYNLRAEYSLHRFVAEGLNMKKALGDWYSPADVCFVLEKLVNCITTREVSVKVFLDGVIYKDQMLEAAKLETSVVIEPNASSELQAKDESFIELRESEERKTGLEDSVVEAKWGRAVLVLLPMMLGLGKISSDYYDVVKEALKMTQSVGVIGGRPRSALYFVGFQDNKLLFLDPHKVQDACQDDSDLRSKLKTYVNDSTRLISLSEVESSLAFGFLFTSALSLQQFESFVVDNREQLKGLIQVQDVTPSYMINSGIPDLQLVESEDSDSDIIFI